ncbi:hypothetical protein A605_14567 (plasmid) [Corynebacterium halotolerans YIM 70093 = DSM 44683]|uniref:TrwC relaxase domain-containing protein n=2 Tax=Corynebacterium halotolerans TaxID=225326 RepID=M1NRA5_9CORY|nr:hypothetical protein A605_14567 [Corynebacterium halotolerans YIM 70093 = DSM 44683]
MRVVHAGDGYAYLLGSVASHDDMTQPDLALADYYQATGTPPGRWFGSGITGLGETSVSVDGVVNEAQMGALYGEGLHPDADARMAAGEPLADVKLGRAYATYTNGVEVLKAVSKTEKQERQRLGRRLTTEERNELALSVARPFHASETGFEHADARVVLAWLNTQKHSVRQPAAGMDLTFSPTKSVSLLWALGDEETRQAIEKIHREAVADSLVWVEDNVLFTRTGERGERQVRARGMIAATFIHYDTRAGDPDLHTHCLIANKVQTREDELSPEDAAKWRALDTRFLHKNSARIGQRYQDMMVHRLSTELGLEFYERTTEENKAPVWEVRGIDEDLIAASSKRRAQAQPVYEEYARTYRETHGHAPSDRAAYELWQQAILDTRDAKKPARSLAEHRREWAQEYGIQNLSARALGEAARADGHTRPAFPAYGTDHREEALKELARQAVDDTRKRRASFAHRHLDTSISMRLNAWRFANETEAAAIRHQVHAVALREFVTTLNSTEPLALPGALVQHGRAIDLESEAEVLTANATLLEEQTVLEAINQPTAYLVTRQAVDDALDRHQNTAGFALNTGQEALVRHLTETGAMLSAGVGPAGTGKTASMAVVADLWRGEGHQVHALAPSARAAQQLGDDIGEKARTLASLTYRWRGELPGIPAHDAQALGVSITPGDMLLVDEAGMATTADLAALTEIAQATGAIVRLVGDPHQLDAVETGGLLRTIVKHDHSTELDQVMRVGDDTAQADAGLKIRHGDTTGLDLYAQRGWIHGGNREDQILTATTAYLQDIDAGRSSILIASTNKDVAAANQLIRTHRMTTGDVQTDGPAVALGGSEQASIGDTILTRRNTMINNTRILNGQQFTVTAIHDDGSAIVQGTERPTPLILPADYLASHAQLGYAATVHRAQGVTVDTTHAVVGPETDRRGLYVALTRGKKENHAYVATDTPVDLDGEDAHRHMSGENTAEPTPLEVLTGIIGRDTGHRSATDLRAELNAQATSDERIAGLYASACDQLTTTWRRDTVEPHLRRVLDQLPMGLTAEVDEDRAVERIATTAVRLSKVGIDYRDHLHHSTTDLEGAKDVGAVIAHRLAGHLPEHSPTRPQLPPVGAYTDLELHQWARETASMLDTPTPAKPVEQIEPDPRQVVKDSLADRPLHWVDDDRMLAWIRSGDVLFTTTAHQAQEEAERLTRQAERATTAQQATTELTARLEELEPKRQAAQEQLDQARADLHQAEHQARSRGMFAKMMNKAQDQAAIDTATEHFTQAHAHYQEIARTTGELSDQLRRLGPAPAVPSEGELERVRHRAQFFTRIETYAGNTDIVDAEKTWRAQATGEVARIDDNVRAKKWERTGKKVLTFFDEAKMPDDGWLTRALSRHRSQTTTQPSHTLAPEFDHSPTRDHGPEL